MNGDINKLASIVEKYHGQRGSLIPVLEEIQDQCLYLSRESLQLVSAVLDLPLSQVYNVATFYNAFSLKPRGRHLFSICMGTACHVKGAEKILRKAQDQLQIVPGETTDDMTFTMETVRCVGCCSLAPVVRVDDQTFGHVTTKKVLNILKEAKSKPLVISG